MRGLLRLGILFPIVHIFLVFGKGQFDIFHQVIVRRALAEGIGGPVFNHESVQFIALEMGHSQHQRGVEPVVDVFILFVFDQSVLEGLQSFCPVELEIADDLVEVEAGAHAQAGAGAVQRERVRLFEVKIFFVVLTVLDRILTIVAWHDPHFLQLSRVYVQRDIKAIHGIEVLDGIFHRGAAEVGEIDGIVVWDGDLVIAAGIGCGAPAGGADDADPVQGGGPIHIVHCSVQGDLAQYATSGSDGHR